jgi:hypothetical protein
VGPSRAVSRTAPQVASYQEDKVRME